MSKIKTILTILFLVFSLSVIAQDNNTVRAIKVRELTVKKGRLEEQILQEDKKRNMSVMGVSPEQMEALNEKQDSTCLELRSQLLEIELELKELMPNKE